MSEIVSGRENYLTKKQIKNYKQMARGRRLTQKSLIILKAIGLVGASFLDVVTTLGPDQYVSGAYRVRYRRSYDLKRSGYIHIKRDKNNRSFFHLTPKGKLQLLKYLHLEKLVKAKWDKQWRVIIFDIPESLKKWRGYLRVDLKNLGFHHLQESVYITPYPVTGELDQLLKECNLRKYFRYLTVSEVDGLEELKKQFNLK